MRRLLMATALAAALSRDISAQRLGPPVERPRLRDVTDTNDANAYFDLGLSAFDHDPETASAAFYWAARINPAWGDPLYARHCALLMEDSQLMRRVFEGNRNAIRSAEVRRLDSLSFRGLLLNPLLYRRLDHRMWMAYVKDAVTRNARMHGEQAPDGPTLTFEIESYMSRAGAATRARMSYGSGNLSGALASYAAALSGANDEDKATIHMERGRIFGMRAEVDSAVGELNVALSQFSKQDRNELVVFYESKALAEYTIATLLEGQGNTAGAREAYGRALQEDLAYYPAHLRLGLLSLGQSDTTSALSELALAAQIATDEPHVRYVHGYVLLAAGKAADALPELKKAIDLEPYYALPYLALAHLYEQQAKGPEALAAYQGFLNRASQNAPQRQYASQQIAEINEYLRLIQAKP